MEFTLLEAVALGALALYGTLRWEARRGNVASCSGNLWDVALTAAVAGIFVGRAAAMINGGVNPLTHPTDLLIVRAGVSTGPATLAALVTLAWLARRELWAVADGLAAAALAGLAGWQTGCLIRDACLGTPTSLPWGFRQSGSAVSRHPVELYAALLLLLGAGGIAWWKLRGRPTPGAPAGLALAIAGLTRLATEPMRPNLGGGPVAWYLAAVIIGIILMLRHHRVDRGDPSPLNPTDRQPRSPVP